MTLEKEFLVLVHDDGDGDGNIAGVMTELSHICIYIYVYIYTHTHIYTHIYMNMCM
jgi:hypothetical protein